MVKQGGLCIYLLPDHKNPIDHEREVTEIDHLLYHDTVNNRENRIQHYVEYLEIVDHLSKEDALKVALEKLERNDDIHFHVFDWELIMEFFLSFSNHMKIEFYYNAGMEHAVVLRKL